MAKLTKNRRERHGILRLKVFVEKLRKGSSFCRSFNETEIREEVGGVYEVPDDVKEGHFVVSAMDGGMPTRFVVPLGYLKHPDFMKLLDKAEEEFGFEQEGALAVPCLASDLQSILRESWKGASGDGE